MYVYSQVAAVVEPKRAKLKEAQAELEVTEHLLKEKQAALKIVSDRYVCLGCIEWMVRGSCGLGFRVLD